MPPSNPTPSTNPTPRELAERWLEGGLESTFPKQAAVCRRLIELDDENARLQDEADSKLPIATNATHEQARKLLGPFVIRQLTDEPTSRGAFYPSQRTESAVVALLAENARLRAFLEAMRK